ncbi:nuclear transport factor 2 family protein [Streptomyces sp. NPDC005786]|uniref:nuclear transport factor 2 family protein n=1 Tax=Streptomyces sp. NPDC005786 TaxID=3154891 RepID=UPI0033F60960
MNEFVTGPTRPAVSLSSPTQSVRPYYSLVDADDITGLLPLFELTAQYRRPGYAELNGHAELERFYRDERVIESGTHSITTLVCEGREVAVRSAFEGVLRDGSKASLRFADFFSVTATGKFSLRETFFFAPLV